MTVSNCAIGDSNMTLEEAQKRFSQPNGSIHPIGQLRAMAALCNSSEFDAADSEVPVAHRKIFGDATDQAVLRFAELVEADSVAYLRACWRRTYELAFNSKNKFMIRCFSCARPESIPQTLHKSCSFDVKDT